MATFRCLRSTTTTSYNTGSKPGQTDTTEFVLPNTPILPGTFTGNVYTSEGVVARLEQESDGSISVSAVGSPTANVQTAVLNRYTGVITLTWDVAPGATYLLVDYTGAPIYVNVSWRQFRVNCPKTNMLCSSQSVGYLPAITVCAQRLFI